MEACWTGNTAQLTRWGQQGGRCISADTLHNCVGNGVSPDVLRCLVRDLGADVNAFSEEGCSPLYFAAQMGRIDQMQCLVNEFGADVNLADIDKHGYTAVMMAA
jgi:ankyrin repeat protein